MRGGPVLPSLRFRTDLFAPTQAAIRSVIGAPGSDLPMTGSAVDMDRPRRRERRPSPLHQER